MKRLYVFADFDWLKEPRLIGELSYESLRGSDSYGFCYSNEWLKDYGSLFLSDDLNNYPGQQYTAPGKDIFGYFSDALPDRWGRTLINRREQILAKEEKRPEIGSKALVPTFVKALGTETATSSKATTSFFGSNLFQSTSFTSTVSVPNGSI